MNLKVHEVGPPDLESWRAVVSWVYEREAPQGPPSGIREGERRFLVTSDDGPAGACSVLDATVAKGRDDLRCGGVAGVATLVQHRRSGVADALMRHVLASMREEGQCLSALYAFRESYYRRFGYESCGWRWQVKCPRERLPRVRSELPVRQIDVSEVHTLDPVYRSFVRVRSGSFLRSKADWADRMGKRKPSVYAVGDPFEGYLWANFEGFWGDVDIGELAWSTPAGYHGCLEVVSSLCSNQDVALWNEPPDSPFVAGHLDQGASCTLHRPSMFRLVDAQGALSCVSSDVEGEFSFDLEDADCPWNHGVWTVRYGRDGTRVERGGSPDFRTRPGPLVQALLGAPDLRSTVMTGGTEVLNGSAFEAAAVFFRPRPVVCMDFF
ncbi:MAG: GNAT family N-acetyltransferase [Armatimonadetes bacterium]|nr:GNAT family N-acetyltransferase [Armatimonadota bacterium]